MRAWSRRRPWPYHIEIEDAATGRMRGYMLRPTQAGEMVGRKATRLDAVTPTTYDYSNLPPYVERPFGFGPCPDGMGQARQEAPNTRYRYGERVDFSIGGVARPGPAPNAVSSPAALGEIRGFVDAFRDGVPETWAFGVGGVARRVALGAEAWVMTDTRAGLTAQQAVVFQPSDASAPLLVYVAYDDGSLRYGTDPGAWASAVLPAGAQANFVERLRDELWVFGYTSGNGAYKATVDPRVAASWAAPVRVGSRDRAATYLKAVDDQLFCFKNDGVYAITTASPFFAELFPELRAFAGGTGFLGYTADDNGRHAAVWDGNLWFGFGGRSYRLTPGSSPVLEPVGLSRLLDNDTPVRGRQTAFAGDNYFGYYAVHNPGTGTSHLVKHGTWVNTEARGPDAYVFNEVPNGSVLDFPGQKITALHYATDDDGQPRLYVGLLNGDGTSQIGWVVLPKDQPDPALDPSCRFATLARAYYPDHDAGAPSDLKHWRGFTAVGPALGATRTVTVEHATEDDPAYTAESTVLTATGQRITSDGALVTKRIAVRATLRGTDTAPPLLASLVLHEQIRPALQLEHDVVVVAAENAARRDGGVDRRTAEQIRDALRRTAGPGPTRVTFPDGTRQVIDFVDYGEAKAPTGRAYGLVWDVPLKLVAFASETVYGTWDRAAAHDWDEAASYDWEQAGHW